MSNLYDGSGPKLFNSLSKDLLQGLAPEPRDEKQSKKSSYQGLNGLTYSLSQTSFPHIDHHTSSHSLAHSQTQSVNKFALPNSEVLNVNDGYLGSVDRWPARLERSGRSHFPSSSSSHDFDPTSPHSKPKFLLDLEAYLATELRTLGLSDRDPPNSARMNVYREVFKRLIQEFTMYKGILSRIGKEYEDYLDMVDKELLIIPKLERKLGTLEDETRLKIDQLVREWETKEANWNDERAQMQDEIQRLQTDLDQTRRAHQTTSAELSSLTTTIRP